MMLTRAVQEMVQAEACGMTSEREMTERDWSLIEIDNFKGIFFCKKGIVKRMLAGGQVRVLKVLFFFK